MNIIFFTALGVGGATMVGAILGFIFRKSAEKFSGYILSLSAGMMLMASITGLVEPAFSGVLHEVLLATFGIISGALTIYLIEKYIPLGDSPGERSALSFAIAIAIHNLPEGIAAGVAFGGGDIEGALGVVSGIALHNLPEGMIVIAPMLAAGVSPRKTFLFAISGGVAEVIGTFIGYYAASLSTAILPLALSFAGGGMLATIAGDMIPESHMSGRRRATLFLVLGVAIMALVGLLFS